MQYEEDWSDNAILRNSASHRLFIELIFGEIYTLRSIIDEGLNTGDDCVLDAETLYTVDEDGMIDRIECSRQIEKTAQCNFTFICSLKNI